MTQYYSRDWFYPDNFPYKLKRTGRYKIKLQKPMIMYMAHYIAPPGYMSDCLIIDNWPKRIDICYESIGRTFCLFHIKSNI